LGGKKRGCADAYDQRVCNVGRWGTGLEKLEKKHQSGCEEGWIGPSRRAGEMKI